jgi:hypothetical protein
MSVLGILTVKLNIQEIPHEEIVQNDSARGALAEFLNVAVGR